MPLLFSYGSLKRADVQRALFGRELEGSDDELVGFVLSVSTRGAARHANVVPDGRAEGRVAGRAFDVTEAELARADAYERNDAYHRIAVTLASGRRGWVYVEMPEGSAGAGVAMSSMFAYVCLGSNNLERSASFYDATLGVLGYRRCDTSGESETSWTGWIGWGLYEKEGAVQDALWVCKPFNAQSANAGNGSMVALWAKSWRQVEEFHARALENGGTSEGAPGLRLLYNPDFYAAYVRDPDGNKLAVVCRGHTSLQGQ